MANEKKGWPGILAQIRTPLVFFALSLLVIEAIFGIVVTFSKMTGDQQFTAFWGMSFLFLVVVGSVIWITIKWPEHLYEKVEKDLENSRMVKQFMNSTGFRHVIADVVDKRTKEK